MEYKGVTWPKLSLQSCILTAAYEFLDVLKVFNIETVVDVRTIPKSLHNPQLNMDSLRDGLEINDIG